MTQDFDAHELSVIESALRQARDNAHTHVGRGWYEDVRQKVLPELNKLRHLHPVPDPIVIETSEAKKEE